MKVFELMAQLSKCPAGAEVQFRTVLTEGEFEAAPVVDSEDFSENRMRSLALDVSEVELIHDSLAVIYQ